jgi:hypothetical protein
MGKLVKSDFVYQNWAWVKRISVFINLGYITLKVSWAWARAWLFIRGGASEFVRRLTWENWSSLILCTKTGHG